MATTPPPEPAIVQTLKMYAASDSVDLLSIKKQDIQAAAAYISALQQKPVAQDDPVAAVDNRRIANYIVEFLRARNGCELEEAIVELTVESYELLIDELEDIIKWRGRPPNWSAP